MKSIIDGVTLDAMLDKYNDFLSLHSVLGEESYRQKADSVMSLIRNMFGSNEKISLSSLLNK